MPSISRRDLLHGTASLAAAGLPATGAAPGLYPPALTGLRGSHDGSFETAHALGRDGRSDFGSAQTDPDRYDLIVVGGGVSGLAAAYFYRRTKPDARILILDNHDDFGGHAKRNEFVVDGRHLIGYGGSQSMEAPGAYSDVAMGLLRELGVDTGAFDTAYDHEFYVRNGLGAGIYFDQATFGESRFVHASELYQTAFVDMANRTRSVADAIDAMPISPKARTELAVLMTGTDDKVPDVGVMDLPDYLSSISYQTFIERHIGISEPDVLRILRDIPNGYFGVGIDVITALEGLLIGLPGIRSLGVPGAQFVLRLATSAMVEPYIYHFPDGNATIARLLARSLVPELSPARKPADLLQTRIDYRQLDARDHNVRIRLSSTAIRVENARDTVAIRYVRHGGTHQVTARHCVLACYNMMIPHLMPELGHRQRDALASLVKVPLVYTNVALRNWRALANKGIGFALTPGGFHDYMMVDFPVSIGSYRFSGSPDEPVVLHHSLALTQPGLHPREQFRIGRARLLATPFADIEADLRTQLDGMLGDAGFDADRDIAAITVNRWPHGYAYGGYSLFDPDYGPGEQPFEVGRQRVGNVTIANSDAGGRAYLDAAIDEAYRAVGELLA